MYTYTEKEISKLYDMWRSPPGPELKLWFRIKDTPKETIRYLSKCFFDCDEPFSKDDFNFYLDALNMIYKKGLIEMPLYINLEEKDCLLRDIAIWRLKLGK